MLMDYNYPFSGKRMFVAWDAQNVQPVKGIREDSDIIRGAIEKRLPGIKTRLWVYADREIYDRRDLYLMNGVMKDIPGRDAANETADEYKILINADRNIMHDIYDFAQDHAPPAFIFLISGDADYYRTMEAMSGFGYSTVVAYKDIDRASNSLRSVADCEFLYKEIITRENFMGGPSRPSDLFLKPDHEIPPNEPMSRRNLVLIDMDSVSLPRNRKHLAVMDQISHFLSSRLKGRYKMFNYVFFGRNIPGRYRQAAGAKYVQTNSSKEFLMENMMITRIGHFMHTTKSPSNIIIYSDKECLASTILSAKSSGFWVTVCSPDWRPHNLLEQACDTWYPTPHSWLHY